MTKATASKKKATSKKVSKTSKVSKSKKSTTPAAKNGALKNDSDYVSDDDSDDTESDASTDAPQPGSKNYFSYCFFLSSSSVQFATCFFVKLI